jgi:uncharacterized membrane protein YgcG
MNKTFRNSALLAALLSAGLAGCASKPAQPDNSAQMADLQARLTRAEQAAADAQAAAAAAQKRADECLAAQDQKIDRAFKKSQQK